MENKKPFWSDALVVFGRMSGWIIAPVILGLFLGKWLDTKLGTTPLLFVVTLGISFLASSFGIAREAGRYMKSITSQKPEHNGTDTRDN